MVEFIERSYIDNTANNKLSFNEIISKNNISIILGEPASGKTYQLEQYKKENSNVNLVELISLEDEEFITKGTEVVLFDSIDEALSKNDSDKLLIKNLLKYIKTSQSINQNIKFIITCRYVEWKEIFEKKLKEIDSEFKIYYIEELSKEDIDKLLIQYNIGQYEFWKFIEENYLEQLLKNILMVINLIEDFDNYKGKKLKYFEVYEKIIVSHLIIKTDNERTKVLDKLTQEEVFKILSIISIYMTLNRQITINIENINQFANELYKLDDIEITGEKLKLIFDTSIFSGNIKNTRFFHKSIQEYLSAYFINVKRLDISTIKNIFSHNEGFYEEFEEVIIYLTNIEERFFYHFVELNPLIFRRHPYLNENEQKSLLISILKLLSSENKYKAWDILSYLEDNSLTKFDLIDDINGIVLNNINIDNVDYEQIRYLKSLLEFNYEKNLEDTIFNIFENSLADKTSCIDYISLARVTNIEFNKRLFEFIKNNNLFLKETNAIRLFTFEILYKKMDFEYISSLLYRFDVYTGIRIVNKIYIEDICFLLNQIIENYIEYKKKFLSKQIIHLIYLILKDAKFLNDKAILNTIFDFIVSERIYLKLEINRYKDKKGELNFYDIKNEFWTSYFTQNIKNLHLRRVLGVLHFYNITIDDMVNVSKKYPIGKYKDYYIKFRFLVEGLDEFLMQDLEFKNYIENIWEKHEEVENEWKKEDEIWRIEQEEQEQKIRNEFQKAKESLSTIEDVYTIYNYVGFEKGSFDDEDTSKYSSELQKELKDKYIDFMNIIKNEFIQDIEYKKISFEVLENGYLTVSNIINYYFKSISKGERIELINNSIEYEKLFWHKYRYRRLNDSYFIEISKVYKKELLQLSTNLIELSMIQGQGRYTRIDIEFISLFQSLNFYDKNNLKQLINKIKDIEISYFKYIDKYDKEYLLEFLILDDNYDFIKNLLLKDIENYYFYFKFLMRLDINKAINDYLNMLYPITNKYLEFKIKNFSNNLKPNYKFNKFDVINIAFNHRKYFKSLLGIIYDIKEDRELEYINKIDRRFIKFILENYFDFFKKYHHPRGTYSLDIYDDMDGLIGKILVFLGNDIDKIPLLEELSIYPNDRLQVRIKYQLNNVYNVQLKNREFNNHYYKDILNNYIEKKEDTRFFNYDILRNNLINICLLETENRKTLSDFSEDEINDRFRTDLLLYKYNVADQSRGGESQSTKSVGERDIVIRNKESGIVETVIEAFNLESLDRTVIEKHYDKLINKYDTTGNKQNFILVYSKVKDFNSLWNKYKGEYIEIEEKTQKDNLRLGYSKEGNMKITHFFINFYSEVESV